MDGDVHLFGLGHYGHGASRGVDAALGFGLGHALDPMDATLKAKQRIGALALNLHHRFLQAALVRLVFVQHRRLEAPPLGEAHVHAENLRGEERGLLATGAGPDFKDDVLGVERVLGDEQPLDLDLAFGDGFFQVGDLHFGHLTQLGVHGLVAQDGLGLPQLLQPRALGLEGQYYRLQLGAKL